MSEERLERIESKVAGLTDTMAGLTGMVAGLTDKVDGLTGRVDGLTDKVDGLTGKVDGLTDRFDGLTGTVATLVQGQTRLETGMERLRHEMHVLHEDTLARIEAMDPRPLIAASERKTFAAVAAHRDEVNRRLDPLETAVRSMRRRKRPR